MSGFREGYTTVGNAIASYLAGGTLPAEFTELSGAGGLVAYCPVSDEIDLVAGVGNFYQVIPACPFKLVRLFSSVAWLTLVGGTRSVVGQVQMGANAAANDMAVAANTNAAVLTQAVDTLSTFFGSTVTPSPVLDLSTNGLRLKVVSAMTGTSPVCKVRLIGFAGLMPL